MQSADHPVQILSTQCCVAGGGPAGMMIGMLLARAGVDVVVLEKHADFLRDFRGDTIHPSTLEVMYELGLLDEFLQKPHQEFSQIGGQVEETTLTIADFSHLPTHCKFIALMPQWDFLNFLAEKGKCYPNFHLLMEAEVTGLVEEGGNVRGVRAITPKGVLEVRAALTVGADGRGSIVREKAGLTVMDLGAPIDVLWMRVTRRPEDPSQALGRIRQGEILVTLNRGDYWQCAYVIPKGGFDLIRQQGLSSFHKHIAIAAPFLKDRVEELKEWTDIKLLTVRVDRLRRWWRSGLLCIGDSAHAMSPVGGVGINLAIQDAVAAANLLASDLRRGAVAQERLRRVQRRREYPTRMTQRLQVLAHKRFLAPTLNRSGVRSQLPVFFRLLRTFPALRRVPARIIGLGFRPEHVRVP